MPRSLSGSLCLRRLRLLAALRVSVKDGRNPQSWFGGYAWIAQGHEFMSTEYTPGRVVRSLEPALGAEVLDLSFSEVAVMALGFGSRGGRSVPRGPV